MSFRTTIKILLSLVVLTTTHSFALDISQLQQAEYSSGKLLGKLKYKRLNEASGIARSSRDNQVFWIINDGGDKPFIYAIDKTGKHLGRYFITGTDNRDWEDITSFSKDGKHFLIIADTGDNNSEHKDSFLWVIKEPELSKYNHKKLNTIKLEQRIRFRYQDGPRDCESIAVDIKNDRILLLSKRTVPAVMYQLPLSPNPKKRLLIATPIAELTEIPQPDFLFILKNIFLGRYASQPTAMDISPDGKELAVLTYSYGYIYQLENGQWEQALTKKPKVFEFPKLSQAEALSFDSDNDILITSEQRPAPIYLLQKQSTSKVIK